MQITHLGHKLVKIVRLLEVIIWLILLKLILHLKIIVVLELVLVEHLGPIVELLLRVEVHPSYQLGLWIICIRIECHLGVLHRVLRFGRFLFYL